MSVIMRKRFKNNFIRANNYSENSKKNIEHNLKSKIGSFKMYTQILYNSINIIPERLKTWILRGIFSVLLIAYFWFTVYVGPLAVMITTLAIQIKCFKEIIDIAHKAYPVNELPYFNMLSWYFLIAANYFCYGETLTEHFAVIIKKVNILSLLLSYHRFVSFCMYFIGIMWFVTSLRRKYDMHQFSLLAFTHVALLLIVVQSYMIVKNIFQGLIWLALPVTLVACNDIAAYVCGKCFGKTPLIKVSPKKTREGFIGAAIVTVIYGIFISYILCMYPYFTCPLKYSEEMGTIKLNRICKDSTNFQLMNYIVNIRFYEHFSTTFSFGIYQFMLHSIILSIFCSLVAPFGGFFASGFKRAFNIKDFGETIPGHGGILDRFDCQFIMATFVNVYITSFVKTVTSEEIFHKVLNLEPYQQIQFYNILKDSLKDNLR